MATATQDLSRRTARRGTPKAGQGTNHESSQPSVSAPMAGRPHRQPAMVFLSGGFIGTLHRMRPAPSVLGREEERDRARERLRSGGGVLLCGPGGIGKSTLMESLAEEAAEAGELVLRTCPNAAEAGLPYLALIDLFGTVLPQVAASLPDHLRTALESALLHAAPPPGTA